MTAHSMSQHVVAVLSFALEANVFNPVPRRLGDFQILQGDKYASNERQAGFVAVLRREAPWLTQGVDIQFVVLYRGFCGGLIPADDFETMKQAAADGLRSIGRSCTGVFLDLHGAMGVSGRGAEGDAEAELVEACREVVGPDSLISASFDLHGNVSERLFRSLDMVTAYRTMPHQDMEETKRKGLRMLLHVLQSGTERPRIVFLPVPVIVSGDKVLTTEGRGVDLYGSLRGIEEENGVMDVSIFVGHQHADEKRVRAAIVLTGLSSAVQNMRDHAVHLAQRFWDFKHEFDYPVNCPLLQWDRCFEQALSKANHSNKAVLIGDFGDNLCAGATGDVPFVLRRFLIHFETMPEESRRKVLVAGLVDPGAVEACCKVGKGGSVPTLRVGAALTSSYGCAADLYDEDARPLEVEASVCATVDAVNGRWAIIQIQNVFVLLQEKAWAFFAKRDFDCLPDALQPHQFAIVVLKLGMNIIDVGAELGVSHCLLANTPGATTEPLKKRPRLDSSTWTAPSDGRTWRASPDQVVVLSHRHQIKSGQ